MEVKIYHSPRCSKSRQTLLLLESKGLKPHVILYLDKGLKHPEVKQLLSLLGVNIREIMRTKDGLFQEKDLGNSFLSENDLIDSLVKCLNLLECPIVVINDAKALIYIPRENVSKLC